MKLVLLHGFCEDHRIWEEMLSHSEYKNEIICIDLPGFGNHSSSYKEATSIEKMADFIKDEITKLKLENFLLVGHSLGGYVTLAYAEKYPDDLAGIGLFHSTATADSEERKEARLKTIEFVKTNGAEAYHRVLIPNLFRIETKPELINQTIALARSAQSDGIISALQAMRNRPDRTQLLQGFQKPVLFIAGEKDTLIPKSQIMQQAAGCEIAMTRVLEHSAHMGQLEEPEESAAIIDYFIEFSEQFSLA